MRGLALAVALFVSPHAQDLGSLDGVPGRPRQYVSFAGEQQILPAARRALLELHFRVVDGFHINSHTPKSALLIPTTLALEAGAGLKLGAPEFPPGETFSFRFDPKEKLDVYQGEFTLRVPLTASAGTHEVHGTLNYQACDRAACYPPRTLPIVAPFTAK